ncbi:MAG: Jag N-terminal domain-containing protein [Anaerolineae bacterium]|nr:Jag N-terminal domain-containing protein [Anaerolineae bacterium]
MTGEKGGEFRGKTIEAAINAGLAALHLSRQDVEVEVVRPGSRGVLGIGAEDAIVRLTVIRPEGRSVPAEAKAAPRTEAPKPAVSAAPQTEPRPEPTKTAPAVRPEASKAASAPASLAGLSEKERAAAELGREFLTGFLSRAGLQAKVEIGIQSAAEAEEGDRVPVLNIVGEDLGVLIGRQNEVLSALEFITRLAVNQRSHTRSHFIVDVNGYRAKRAESLRKLGLRMAEQAVQSGRTVILEPMPPAERRIIHLALRNHPKVFTQSIGEGDHRKVTIVLKKD